MSLTVRHCCCGCSLRSGTTIIAMYLLVFSVLLTVYSSVMLGYIQETNQGMRAIFIVAIFAGAAQTILNILLLVGVHKENKSILTVWLGGYYVICAQSLIFLIMSFFHFFANPYYQLGVVINIGLTLYFLLVVRSYHHSLSDGHNTQQNAADVYNIENSNIKRMPLA